MVTLGGTLIDTGTSILNQQISVLITQSHRVIHVLGGIGGVAVTLGGIGGTFLIWMTVWVVVVTLNHTLHGVLCITALLGGTPSIS